MPTATGHNRPNPAPANPVAIRKDKTHPLAMPTATGRSQLNPAPVNRVAILRRRVPPLAMLTGMEHPRQHHSPVEIRIIRADQVDQTTRAVVLAAQIILAVGLTTPAVQTTLAGQAGQATRGVVPAGRIMEVPVIRAAVQTIPAAGLMTPVAQETPEVGVRNKLP